MKRLNELYDCSYDVLINEIKINSKEVTPGDLFVCIKGVNFDRHDFIDEAISNGASALIVKKDGNYSVPYIVVEDPDAELKRLAQIFYDNPLDKIKLIGTTGTDGKTTVATIIRDLLGSSVCGYMGTNGVDYGTHHETLKNTTPEAHIICKYLDKMIKEKQGYASIETSSEAFYRNRLDRFAFDIGVFTNITGDHLNIHKTHENYVECKKDLFRKIKETGFSILNKDDPYYEEIRSVCSCNVLTYGKNNDSNLVILDIQLLPGKTNFKMKYQEITYDIESPLCGEFNVYNLSAAILALIGLGFSIDDIIQRVKNVKVPNGRCEFLDFGQDYNIVLDYAHTPRSLNSILTYLNEVKESRIITVTGSAGGREHEKRKEMGKVVLEKSDLVIFTMDDPRNENVVEIINQMISDNSGNYLKIIDRKEAIMKSFDLANSNDIILITGKGRDNYMAIGNEYVPYSDYEVICEYFNKK